MKIKYIIMLIAGTVGTTAVFLRKNQLQKSALVYSSCKDEVIHLMKWADVEVQNGLGLSQSSLDIYSLENSNFYLESRRYKIGSEYSRVLAIEKFKYQFLERGSQLENSYPSKHIRFEVSVNDGTLSFVSKVSR